MSLAPLPADTVVFRLFAENPEHFASNATKPHPEMFGVTDDDRAEGKARGQPAMLSVFDQTRTTPAQARAIRSAQAAEHGRTIGPTAPFAWDVGTISALALPNEKPRLHVLDDPLDPKWGAGSEGHAAISGLDGVVGEPKRKAIRKLLRSMLRDACHPIAG